MGLITLSAGFVTLLYLLRKYREKTWGWCNCQTNMTGKIVVITGANSGIGFEAAKDLLNKGATVILGCRSSDKALKAIDDIRKATKNGDVVFLELELSSYDSIKLFVSRLLTKYQKIDVLINNAGVYYPPQDPPLTNDKGIEIHFAVNHLGHFLLTHLLIDTITDTPQSRILIVSSELYKTGSLHLDDLTLGNLSQTRKGRNPLYSNSKLANLLHARELSHRLRATGVTVCSISPGFVYTGLFRNSMSGFWLLKKIAFLPIAFFFMRSTMQGAQTTIHCASSEHVKPSASGDYYQNCKQLSLLPVATDDLKAKELWRVSEEMLNLT